MDPPYEKPIEYSCLLSTQSPFLSSVTIDALGCNKDSLFITDALHAIVGPKLSVRSSTRNVIHSATDPVEGKDESVQFAVTVIIRDANSVLSTLAVDVD
jgi:hypothetical protein